MDISSKNSESMVLIFDWGDTVMRDYNFPGKMADWAQVDWIPGAESTLKLLSKNYICCIATSASHSSTHDMIAALKMVGADRYFRNFFSSGDLGYSKPDPRFFKIISEKLGVEPKNCIVIGNLYEKDIVGAKQIGMKTILFNEKREEGNFILADAVIFDMLSLYDVVNDLINN